MEEEQAGVDATGNVADCDIHFSWVKLECLNQLLKATFRRNQHDPHLWPFSDPPVLMRQTRRRVAC